MPFTRQNRLQTHSCERARARSHSNATISVRWKDNSLSDTSERTVFLFSCEWVCVCVWVCMMCIIARVRQIQFTVQPLFASDIAHSRSIYNKFFLLIFLNAHVAWWCVCYSVFFFRSFSIQYFFPAVHSIWPCFIADVWCVWIFSSVRGNFSPYSTTAFLRFSIPSAAAHCLHCARTGRSAFLSFLSLRHRRRALIEFVLTNFVSVQLILYGHMRTGIRRYAARICAWKVMVTLMKMFLCARNECIFHVINFSYEKCSGSFYFCRTIKRA